MHLDTHDTAISAPATHVSEDDWGDRLVERLPELRAFGLILCRDRALADDMVQDTLVKALRNRERFQEGTNLKAWLFTILRNTFYSHSRKFRERADPEGELAARLVSPAAQLGRSECADVLAALEKLSPEHREVILLVAMAEMPYEEAAEVCGVAEGTIKSRLNRARKALLAALEPVQAAAPGERVPSPT